ncbi:hypothetical protein H6G36_11235 [Anabaena minutissima FACHB-250]|nr:hypothetical protein [Anabaena minutissima FACHB-250]
MIKLISKYLAIAIFIRSNDRTAVTRIIWRIDKNPFHWCFLTFIGG